MLSLFSNNKESEQGLARLGVAGRGGARQGVARCGKDFMFSFLLKGKENKARIGKTSLFDRFK